MRARACSGLDTTHLRRLPSAALTALSFTVFFMSFQVGERLGVGVTLVLMIEVAKVTMSSMIPVCGELLWLEIFCTP